MEAVIQFLFVSLLILLAIIGYRAMLRKFQRGQVVHKAYCELYTLDQEPAQGELAFYFVCPQECEVKFAIWQFNQIVCEVAQASFEKGGHILRFDSTKLANGVYYYGIVTADQETKKRMTIAN
ncbi:MAG: hypothetical protein RIR94_748 [Bacteroidota bacterium]|jgi:hypothetical protein